MVHAGFLSAEFFDALTPGCVPGSPDKPCGSELLFGITFTDGFVDDEGNFTDVNHDGQFDVAFREIYYNSSDPDANGVTVHGGSMGTRTWRPSRSTSSATV